MSSNTHENVDTFDDWLASFRIPFLESEPLSWFTTWFCEMNRCSYVLLDLNLIFRGTSRRSRNVGRKTTSRCEEWWHYGAIDRSRWTHLRSSLPRCSAILCCVERYSDTFVRTKFMHNLAGKLEVTYLQWICAIDKVTFMPFDKQYQRRPQSKSYGIG